MAFKLNQVIAINKGAKADGEGALTKAYHQLQQSGRLAGVARTYQPRDDEGDKLPDEGTRLQLHAKGIVDNLVEPLGRLFDIELTKDAGNQIASANLSLPNGETIHEIPVTFLLTLEKKLVDIHTFIGKLPVLDPAENWTWSDSHEAWVTVSQTVRTKKVPQNHVKSPATDKHPAQVEIFTTDEIVGTWTTTKLSGALPQTVISTALTRVRALQEAVKIAREQANATEVPPLKIGEQLLGYLFDGVAS